MSEYHIPVLLGDSINGLAIKPNGDYVDATYGGGGHSLEILNQLVRGRLFAFDQDEDAAGNIHKDDRLFFIRHNFRYMKNFLRYYGVEQVDGILADLGVSSHDFDEAERGFSFRFDSKLDMRMNQMAIKSAESIINQYGEEELKKIFIEYGEVKNAGQLTTTILNARQISPIRTTQELKNAIRKCIPKSIENKYMAQVFQAIRIEVNDEILALKDFLQTSLDILKTGGRLVVITYHSLEDRLVKNYMKSGNFEGTVKKDFYGNVSTPFRLVTRKIITPSEKELKNNPRSRSAKLRIAEKL